MSTERQLPRTPVAKPRKGDPAIYLRTYDVINSLDRAGKTPWWEKAFTSVSRIRQISQTALKARLTESIGKVSAPPLPPSVQIAPAAPAKKLEAPAPLPSENTLTLLRADGRRTVPEPAARPTGTLPREGRQVSWVLLAVVAMITAGLTFAAIHFAWSLTAREGSPQRKHVSSYVSSQSPVPPSSLLGQKILFHL